MDNKAVLIFAIILMVAAYGVVALIMTMNTSQKIDSLNAQMVLLAQRKDDLDKQYQQLIMFSAVLQNASTQNASNTTQVTAPPPVVPPAPVVDPVIPVWNPPPQPVRTRAS